MKILGISAFYHESAASLIEDGRIVAASAEERFTRIKHDWVFPRKAIDFCLNLAGIESKDLDWVVFYEKPFRRFERNLEMARKHFPYSRELFIDSTKNFLSEKLWIKSIISSYLDINPSKILFVPHHLSHVAASFYNSPFEKAAFLSLDGVGEWTTGLWGEATDGYLSPRFELQFPNSVGLLYSTFTAFLGFKVNDGEYKVMGMASYGKPKYVELIKKTFIQFKDGSIKLDLSYFDFPKSSQQMYSKKFIREFSGLDKFNLASSLQKCFEEIVFKMMNCIYQEIKSENLVYSGGVALNSTLNSKITEQTPFKNVFIFPASGDDGGSIGAALFVYYHVLGLGHHTKLENIFLGNSSTNDQIKKVLEKSHIKYQRLPDYVLIKKVGGMLAKGLIVGWFEGRSEFGPRSLGHRSILADPRNPMIKDRLNSTIKFREEFRPFAPAVLEEQAQAYYQNLGENLTPYMLGTFKAKKKTLKKAPGVVHVDNTSRIQAVAKSYPGKFRRLLEEFYRITDLPILLNTSFNIAGEPIVDTPEQAIELFEKTPLDLLVLENFLLIK